MVQGEPLVSVVMATRNGPRFIREAIDSVLRQTYRNFEFIIIDDASSDGGVDVVSSLADDRIRLVINGERLGLTKSLNRGIMRAHGEYLARIDDDDVWIGSDKLERQVAFMRRNEEVGVCGVQHNIVIDERGRELYRLRYETDDRAIRQKMLGRNQFPHASVLVRRAALEEMGLYDEQYRYAQDFELWLRVGLKYKLANLPCVCIKQRVNLRGVTSRKNRQQFFSFVRITYRYRNKYPGFYKNWPVYGSELVMNLLPKPAFYYLSGWRRQA